MSELRKVQMWGLATKIITLILGIVQTAIVVRILQPTQYGIAGIVVSLGSLVGVSQQVGITDATIREIAIAQSPKHRAHIFWVSLWFRLIFTVPISIILALVAPIVSEKIYNLPEITNLLRLMSLILIIQAIQGVLGGVYTGLRAFKLLYFFQIAMALTTIPVFVALCYFRGVSGFFQATLWSAVLFIVLMIFFLRKTVGGGLEHPNRKDFVIVWKEIFHTSIWTYIAKIFSVSWQRVPLLILGWLSTPYVAGLYNAALSIGSGIVILASAIGEVNLAFLSNAFSKGVQDFKEMAEKTLDEVGGILILAAAFLALFPEVVLKILAGDSFMAATSVAVTITWAYALFSFIDIASNTIFVPARRSQFRAFALIILLIASIVSIYVFKQNPLAGTGWGILLGSFLGLLSAEFFARRKMQISLFSNKLILVSIPGAALLAATLWHPSLFLRVMIFVIFGGMIVLIMGKYFFKKVPFINVKLKT